MEGQEEEENDKTLSMLFFYFLFVWFGLFWLVGGVYP